MEYLALGLGVMLALVILSNCAMAIRGRDDGWPDVLLGLCGLVVLSVIWAMLAYSCMAYVPAEYP